MKKTDIHLFVTFVAFLFGNTIPLEAQVYYPVKDYVSNSAGYVQSYVNGGWYRGSGCIVRDARLVYSCAHVLFEDGRWATRYRFSPGYNSYYSPSTTSGIAPRGFRYFTNYASYDNTYGGNSPRTYSIDFTVMYHTTNFGPAVGWWPSGSNVLRSNRWKRIIGYPKTVDYTSTAGRAYQHATPWFRLIGTTEYGSYIGLRNVSTGGGNSGGPVMVWDGSDSYFAGVLVSGTATTCGIRASDSSSDRMATDALAGVSNKTRTFSNTSAFRLPDASTAYSTRSVRASGFSGSVQSLKFSTQIITTYRGDLDIYLRSPSGRIRWVSKRAGGSADNLVRTNADYSPTFRGYAANGRWDLRMRDAVSGDRAVFRSFSIKITAP